MCVFVVVVVVVVVVVLCVCVCVRACVRACVRVCAPELISGGGGGFRLSRRRRFPAYLPVLRAMTE